MYLSRRATLTWGLPHGYPHGGNTPKPVITTDAPIRGFVGDVITILGDNILPGSVAQITPTNLVVGSSLPTVVGKIDITVPDVVNMKYLLVIVNIDGNTSEPIEFYVEKDVSLSTTDEELAEVIVGGFS